MSFPKTAHPTTLFSKLLALIITQGYWTTLLLHITTLPSCFTLAVPLVVASPTPTPSSEPTQRGVRGKSWEQVLKMALSP